MCPHSTMCVLVLLHLCSYYSYQDKAHRYYTSLSSYYSQVPLYYYYVGVLNIYRPHPTIYASSYCYISSGLILLRMCSQTTMNLPASYYYILILLGIRWPHTAIYVSGEGEFGVQTVHDASPDPPLPTRYLPATLCVRRWERARVGWRGYSGEIASLQWILAVF